MIYDVIVVGGGHNGLISASYLAKAGKSVLLIEGSDHLGGASITGAFGMVAAFNDSDEWLDSVIARLEINKKLIDELVSGTPLKVSNPHNSYLSWIDFRDTDLGEDPAAVILERAKIAVNSGLAFGEPGKGFVRLNFGTSAEILQSAFSGIKSLL